MHSRIIVVFASNFDINEIKNSSKEAKAAFLRGFFDSEGSSYVMIKYGVTNRKIEICNNDLQLIKFCKKLLAELGIKTRKIDIRYRSERILKGRKLPPFTFYRLTLRENVENFKKFRNLIGFSIKRKQDNLDEIITSYREFRSKWGNMRREVFKKSEYKKYSEIIKEFSFVPEGTLGRWISEDKRKFEKYLLK